MKPEAEVTRILLRTVPNFAGDFNKAALVSEDVGQVSILGRQKARQHEVLRDGLAFCNVSEGQRHKTTRTK